MHGILFERHTSAGAKVATAASTSLCAKDIVSDSVFVSGSPLKSRLQPLGEKPNLRPSRPCGTPIEIANSDMKCTSGRAADQSERGQFRMSTFKRSVVSLVFLMQTTHAARACSDAYGRHPQPLQSLYRCMGEL